jgi:regulator of protease activity HflC (stomatin/prohibitin superfamily)
LRIGTLAAVLGGQAQYVKEARVGGYRWIIAITVCAGVVLYLYNPTHWGLIVLAGIVVLTLAFFMTMRPVPEPYKAVVFRLAKFDHLAGPGYIFLVPTLDKIQDTLDTAPREPIAIEVPQIRTADNEQVRTNLEVTWRIHPEVNGRITPKVKTMILMDEKHRIAFIQEVVISMARQVISMYHSKALGTAANREAAAATMKDGTNEILEEYGLQVDRVFWRGSVANAKVMEAKVAAMVAQEHTESLIKTVEAIRTHLPDMQPEEFLALQAWLDMFRRGEGGPLAH